MTTPQLSLSVQYALKLADLPNRHQFRRWVKAALQGDAEVTLRVVDAEEGQSLNREYRDKDYATNVLTFVFDDMPEGVDLPLMGDIVLCDPVVRREAQEQGKTLEAHYAHLVVHGILHMQGYDHETDAEAEEMEALETRIVTKLGYDNPYQIKKDQ
ncbi:putative rRNA maturation factor [Chitinivorax tropicus]|uniref:Endoribonuclease YbeY n=1 Tax=Chitinivorax tropicus TaxID=714531 RepID=A0A840MKD4_9PROT|nr:rRNA maturation RNase YbeY [Chitinivorax tropicus]MBB5018870.1 putative rRNA maturation factor [Chitinivorax tropicus]